MGIKRRWEIWKNSYNKGWSLWSL